MFLLIFQLMQTGYDAPITKRAKLETITYNDTQIVGNSYLDSEPSVTAVAKTDIDKYFLQGMVESLRHFC